MFWMMTDVEKALERSSFEIDVLLVAVQCTVLAVRLVISAGSREEIWMTDRPNTSANRTVSVDQS